MRKGYSLLLLLWCCTWASAQNWAPINTTDKYNYKLDTASAISHTLWVDSVQVVGGDTVYFMNRIVVHIRDIIFNGQQAGIALRNQPQFLQNKVVIKSSGTYSFDSPSHIAYNPAMALGNSILYDTTANITATVTWAGISSILGNMDSIKVLTLSSGDSIVASKNFGFVRYPYDYGSHKYYQLVGVEGGRNMGEHVAKFTDFFNYQPSDVFEYHSSGTLDVEQAWSDSSVVSILSRASYADTIVDSVHLLETNWDYYNNYNDMQSINNQQHLSTRYILPDTSMLDVNLYPNTIRQVLGPNNPNWSDTYYYNFIFGVNAAPYVGCPSNHHPNGGLVYYVGAKSYKSNNRVVKVFNVFYQEDSLGSDTLFTWQDVNYRTFKTGLGLTDYVGYDCSDYGNEGHLFAYRTSADSSGVIDTFIAGIEEVKEIAFTIQPNPVTNLLNIQLPEPTNATIRLLDINCREVLTQQATDSHIAINTSSLPAGMYIVEVRTKDGVGRKKVVKM